MRLIQTFYTDSGKNLDMGFTSRTDMLDFLSNSIAIHQQNYELIIYTDKWGYDFLKSHGINMDVFVIHNFRRFDGRFWNAAKIDVLSIQIEKFIHVDIDAVIYEKFDFDYIVTEQYRYPKSYGIAVKLKLGTPVEIVCSGLYGFADMALKNTYCDMFFNIINNWNNYNIRKVDYECLWTVEEVLLTSLLAKRADVLPTSIFKHLHALK